MPTVGLAKFGRESFAARDEALELGRRGLADVATFSHRMVIAESPVVDPDLPGSGRLRASWTISRHSPDLRFAPLPAGGGRLPVPSEESTQAVADAVQLGDVIWIANGSPCVSTVNDRTSFVDQVIAATTSRAQEIATALSSRIVSGLRAIQRARARGR